MFRLAGLLVLAGVMSGQTQFTVRVWDYAGIAAPVLASAETELSYLFGQAGLQVEWLACNPANRQGPGCDVPSASNVILRILVRSASGAAGADVLGRAWPAPSLLRSDRETAWRRYLKPFCRNFS